MKPFYEGFRSDFRPELKLLTYWIRKEKFKFYADTSQYWTVFAVEKGSFQYEFGTEKGVAGFGDYVICPPDTEFRRVVISPLTFFALQMTWADAFGNAPDRKHMSLLSGKFSIQDTKRLSKNYEMMRKAERMEARRRLTLANHYMHDIWLMSCDELVRGPWAVKDDEQSQVEPLMAQASVLIQKHAFQPFDIQQIAAELNLSPVRFTQKFKASFGMPPLQYLTSLRLEKVKTLLLETDMTLEQIAECVGYRNGYYLNRLFKKQLQITPTGYRKLHQV